MLEEPRPVRDVHHDPDGGDRAVRRRASSCSSSRAAADANIQTGGDAIWWGIVTITTVGYGDFYPVTLAGRLTGVFVMFAGIGIIGALASILASMLVSPSAPAEPAAEVESGAVPVGDGERAARSLRSWQACGPRSRRCEPLGTRVDRRRPIGKPSHGILRFERCRLVFWASLPKYMCFASTNRPGCSAVVAHVLWEPAGPNGGGSHTPGARPVNEARPIIVLFASLIALFGSPGICSAQLQHRRCGSYLEV